jgi:hypothetical protein
MDIPLIKCEIIGEFMVSLYSKYAKGYLNYLYDIDLNVDVKPEYYFGQSREEALECLYNIGKLLFQY